MPPRKAHIPKRDPSLRRPHFVAEWREFRGLTGQDLADKLGTTKASISRIENLRTAYNQDTLEPIADALGVHVSTLLSRAPDPEKDGPVEIPTPAAIKNTRRR